jgi:hypothetical protein
MPTIEILPVATGGGANVDTQAGFAGSGYQTGGFSAGLAQSKQVNKIMRQASFIAAAIANFIANILNVNVLDDGNLNTLITNFTNAVKGAAAQLVSLAFSATPVFDASAGNTFEITLTGNVTSSTLINLTAGQRLTFIIHQDATGGRTLVPPGNLPLADIDPTASKTSVQVFQVGVTLAVYPTTGLTVT